MHRWLAFAALTLLAVAGCNASANVLGRAPGGRPTTVRDAVASPVGTIVLLRGRMVEK